MKVLTNQAAPIKVKITQIIITETLPIKGVGHLVEVAKIIIICLDVTPSTEMTDTRGPITTTGTIGRTTI